jgi:hypothetical protein
LLRSDNRLLMRAARKAARQVARTACILRAATVRERFPKRNGPGGHEIGGAVPDSNFAAFAKLRAWLVAHPRTVGTKSLNGAEVVTEINMARMQLSR